MPSCVGDLVDTFKFLFRGARRSNPGGPGLANPAGHLRRLPFTRVVVVGGVATVGLRVSRLRLPVFFLKARQKECFRRQGFVVFAGCLFKDRGGEGSEELSRVEGIHVLQLDVTNDDDLRKAQAYVKENLPPLGLWGIVNNAGACNYGKVEWVPLHTFKWVAEVNLWGPVRIIKTFLPLVRRAKEEHADRIQGALAWLTLLGIFVAFLSPVLWLLGVWPPLVFACLASACLAVFFLKARQKVSPNGRGVLITGCDSGFGHTLALHLHSLECFRRQGFVVFAGCLFKDRGGEGSEELSRVEGIHVLQLDVTNDDDLRKAQAYVKENLPPLGLWGIVNNAGACNYGKVEWVPLHTFKWVAEVNLWGPVRVIKTFLPLVRRAKGRVVNVTSMLGRMGGTQRGAYALTKYGLEGLSDCLRYEMRSFGVHVCIVEPGNFLAGNSRRGNSPELYQSTKILTEDRVTKLAEEMWEGMDAEVKSDYGKEDFDRTLQLQLSLCRSGLKDRSPVIRAMTSALTDSHPLPRYQATTLYSRIRCFVATHLPEIVYEVLYENPHL
ncbi:unnamed protein product [Darwinula stevensoni]|uniref:D-beta-hydroxybutyrate dehydrogenase, mitochondrial n=1 Tax=Darwinula stevensoni TaxID=69355 RepID=A0A7R9AFC2_9CRUS|nr:unnamed protein product [Darwinula stevensoni]CAG0902480.1 unnamed protein product [Darwinula stevensoni]